MDKNEIEIYSQLVDNAVIRMPERNILGSVIQGDSLFLLHADLIDVLESHKHEPDSELFYRIYSITKNIEQRLKHYLSVCEQSSIEVNFDMEFSVEDYEDLL